MDRYRVAPARPVCLSGPSGHLRPAAPCGPATGRRPGCGAEIGIFTAERYFSAADVVRRHDAALLPHALPLPPSDHHHEPPLPKPFGAASDVASQSGRTTAASSEASWNSRSGLLSGHHSAAVGRAKGPRPVGGGSGNASGGGKKTGPRWTLFGRDCPCAGRKAVVTADAAASEMRSPATDARFSAQSAVEECLESAIFKAAKPLSPPPMMRDEEPPGKVKVTVTPGSRALFPLAANGVLAAPGRNRGAAAPAIGRRAGGFAFPTRFASGGSEYEPPRASLEVFHPIDEDSVVLADPPPPAAPRGGDLVPQDEEAMSDASSDLFDLESFAASSSYPTTYRGRGRSRSNSEEDDLPLPLPYAVAEPALSECGMYAPSEASVVWSVATAEGGTFDAASTANFSSAASACGGGVDEFRFVVPDPEFTAAMSRGAAGRKKGGGFLDSCRCEKAVSVGPTPVRMVKPPAYPASAAKKGSGSAARRHPGRVHVPIRT